jgi:hypothetical protein
MLPLLTAPVLAQGAPPVYYIAPNGDDSAPGTEAQPWRSLSRVESVFADGLAPGTQFLFQRGGVYPGSLTADYQVTGTAELPIVFGAYGEGAEPIINGLVPLTRWTNLGGNRWQVACPDCAPRTDLLMVDGEAQAFARYPNLDEGDEGYLYFDAATGRSSITDDGLASGPDWTGGQLVIRSIAWVLDRYPITRQQGGRLTLGPELDETNYDFEVGYGYFIQNHPAALDREGEWVWDADAKIITLYSITDPNQRRIETTITGTLVSLSNMSHVELRDLALHGGREFTLDVVNCEALRLKNLEILYSAADAVQFVNCTNLELANSRIAWQLSHGLRTWQCNQCHVHHNLFEHIGLLAGMGRGGDGQYNGVSLVGEQSSLEYNTLQYIGYNPMSITGKVSARYNFIQYYALVKVDSGGIGTYRTSGGQIIGNIVLNGLGSDAAIPWGTPAVNGIYIDDESEDIDVRDNVVGYVGSNGIVLHNTRNIRVVNNTIFAAGGSGISLDDDNLGTLESTDSLIENNRVFSFGQDALPLRAQTALSGEDWLGRLGTLRDNRYCNPLRANPVSVAFQPNWFTRDLSLAGWQARYGYDQNSRDCGIEVAPYAEIGEPGPNRIVNSTLDSNSDGWYGWPDTSLELAWDAKWEGSLRFGHIGNDPNVLTYHSVGAAEAGQTFRVRFHAQSETDGAALQVYLQQAGPDYLWRSETVRLEINRADEVHTVYLSASEADPDLRLTFDLQRGEGGQAQRLWLDDIEVVPVAVEAVPLESVARLETNASDAAVNFTLDDHAYLDLDGNRYDPGSEVTIQPFSGLILVREPIVPAVLELVMSPATARPGDSVALNLNIADASNLYGIEVHCTVDPAILTGEARVDGTVFSSANSFFVDSGPGEAGRWSVAASRLNPAPAFAGEGTLFSLGYTAVSTGQTSITCDVLAVDSNGNALPLTVGSTDFTVAAG